MTTYIYDVFFVGRAWYIAAAGAVQDPARCLHATWGLSDVAIAGRVSEILRKAWTHKQKSGFLTYAPLIERHHWNFSAYRSCAFYVMRTLSSQSFGIRGLRADFAASKAAEARVAQRKREMAS